jgi:murein DD-endopeptidase MepM/ murein hydrolase activator NlpD
MKLITSKGRTRLGWILLLLLIFLLALGAGLFFRLGPELRRPARIDPAFQWASPILLASLPTAARFDFPIGSEHGALAYNAQPFTENRHLGDDLNGIGGENSDLGDPVYAVADGYVLFAEEAGPGWGNVIIVLHAYEENGERKYVQSYYAHVDTIMVQPKQNVRRGEQIATIGNADGRYWAHLHFEMREFTTAFIGPGYRGDTRGWINPSAFISGHRGAAEDDVGRAPLLLKTTPAPAR